MGVGAGDEVLMPAYHHGSEVQPLVERGIRLRFYDSDERLRPVPEQLEELMSPRVRALHLTHFLGFPQPAREWREWCDERRLLLIEDAAQAWLAAVDGEPVGSFGDLAFFCLYKTFGLGEGAAAVCASELPVRDRARRVEISTLLRLHAAWVVARSRTAATMVAARRRRGTASEPGRGPDVGLKEPERPFPRSTLFLLRRLGGLSARDRRRGNYRRLLELLPGRAPQAFNELPAGASPFAFPITVADKPRALAALARAGIEAIDFWSVPHPSLDEGRYPVAAQMRSTVLALPVHQELRSRDLERIADEVRRLEA